MRDNQESGRVVYVDVDDTLVRSVGQTRIPMPGTVEYVRALKKQGNDLCSRGDRGEDGKITPPSTSWQ